MNFGKRLKEIRLKQNLSQSKVASRMGVKQQTIAQYEKAEKTPKHETIQKLALALGVSEVELLGLSKEEFLKPLKDEVAYLNYLFTLGYEYIDTFFDNEDRFDRCIHVVDEDIDIPLTKEEYEQLKKSIIEDTETELYKLRKNKGL